MPRGGARKGAGRKPGTSGLEKEEARALLRQMVTEQMGPLVSAQIENAKGIKFLMVREKLTGKFVKVGKDAAEKLDPSQEIIEVWEKDPSVQAFTDLMNRAIDKPVEQVVMDANVNVSGNIVETLASGRKRVANASRRD